MISARKLSRQKEQNDMKAIVKRSFNAGYTKGVTDGEVKIMKSLATEVVCILETLDELNGIGEQRKREIKEHFFKELGRKVKHAKRYL